jgi:DNA repair protein RecO (recombination protein O)
MIIRTEAIVLRALDYGETSEIVTLFSRELGRIAVMARGSRSAKSRFGGALQPMAHIQAILYHKPTRDIQSLTETSILHPRSHISESLGALTAGLRIVELIGALMQPEERHEEVFDLASEMLQRLHEVPGRALSVQLFFELRLAVMMGFEPDVRKESVMALGEDGGVLILEDGSVEPPGARSGGGRRASRAALRAFAVLSRASADDALRMRLDPPVDVEVANLVEDFLQYHLAEAYPSRGVRVSRALRGSR